MLHLRENDLRDCLGELATRWREAFVRKQVRLEATLDSNLPIFKFDYQKVQQTVANLLDNALKHTPAASSVALYSSWRALTLFSQSRIQLEAGFVVIKSSIAIRKAPFAMV